MDELELIRLIKECDAYIKYSKRYCDALIYIERKAKYESLLEKVAENIIPLPVVSTP